MINPLRWRGHEVSRLLPYRAEAPHPMQPYQLANAAAIYATGFTAVFVVFALLYHHAYRQALRARLERDALADRLPAQAS